jgi:hypothetical protein
MSEHDVLSQSTFESTTARSGEASGSGTNDAATDSRIAICEKLVDEAVEREWPATTLADALKDLGLKAIEAVDYLDELKQRLEIRRSKARRPETPPHQPPALTEEPAQAVEQEDRNRAVEEAAWASLRAKLDGATVSAPFNTSSEILDKMLDFLGQESASSTSLSKSVLAVAPHLADDEDSVFVDPYLSETQKYKFAYASQKPFEILVIKAQGRKVLEPVANSIWKLVILDKYVDFEKLYATLDPSYNPNDEAKELNERFSLLEKNSISSKRSVESEAEWMRLYDVWAGATLHFYPHRKAELASYRDLIVNMFRAAPSPSPAIKFDRDSRERYSRQPYRLDSCKDVLPFPLLSQLLACTHGAPSSSKSKKRSADSQEGRRKRSETVCQNWNLGACDGDTCNYGRKHNICSECGEPHQAKDRTDCYSALTRRRQQQRATATRGGRK